MCLFQMNTFDIFLMHRTASENFQSLEVAQSIVLKIWCVVINNSDAYPNILFYLIKFPRYELTSPSNSTQRRFPSYLFIYPFLIFSFHLLPCLVHPNGFSFYILPGFFAIFIMLSSSNNNILVEFINIL